MIILTENTRWLLSNRITKALIEDVKGDYEAIKMDIESKIENEKEKSGKVQLLKDEYQKCIDELRIIPVWQANRTNEQMVDFENEPKINIEYLNSVTSESIRGYLLNNDNHSNEAYSEHSQRLNYLFEKEGLYFKMYNLALDVIRNKENGPIKPGKKVNPFVTIWNEIIAEQETQAKKWDKIFYTDIDSPEKGKLLFSNYQDFRDGLLEIQLELEENFPEIFNPNTDNDLWIEFIGDLEGISSELQHKEIDLLGQYFYPLVQVIRRRICLMCIRDFINCWTGLISNGIDYSPNSFPNQTEPSDKQISIEKYDSTLSVDKNIKDDIKTFRWVGDNKEVELDTLFEGLRDKKVIARDTDKTTFKKLFQEVTIKDSYNVVWLFGESNLAYFFEGLLERQLILKRTATYNSKIKNHKLFISSSGKPFKYLKTSKSNYQITTLGAPKDSHIIDEVLNLIVPLEKKK